MIFGTLVFLAGLIITIAWEYEIWSIIQFPTGAVTIKALTSISAIAVGIQFFFCRKNPQSFVGLSAAGSQLWLHLPLLCFGYELLPYSEVDLMVETISLGEPSKATSFLYLTVALFGLCYGIGKCFFIKTPAALVTFGASVSALVGHYLHEPSLYFFEPGLSTGMAVPTAVIFLFCGIEMFIILYDEYKELTLREFYFEVMGLHDNAV